MVAEKVLIYHSAPINCKTPLYSITTHFSKTIAVKVIEVQNLSPFPPLFSFPLDFFSFPSVHRFAAQVAGFDILDLNFILILRAEQNFVINPRSGTRQRRVPDTSINIVQQYTE